MSPFSIDAAARLPGPESLRQRRLAAAERLAAAALAQPRRAGVALQPHRASSTPSATRRPTPTGVARAADRPWRRQLPYVPRQRCGLIVTVDGALVHQAVDPRLVVGAPPRPGAAGGGPGRANGQWSPLAPDDVFALANEAFARDGGRRRGPGGVVFEQPLVVVHRLVGDGLGGLPPARGAGRARRRSSRSSRWWSATRPPSSAPVVHLAAERDARLGYLAVQDLGPRAWQIANQVAEAETQATITSSVAAFGGDYARLRTDCSLVGRGATANLVSLYFGDGHQMLDFRTFQDHRAPDTTSDLLFKGAVDDESHSVYTGLIRVRPTRPGHQRLPDQPQHQAVRAGLGRVGARPRDREQRRALLPRLDRRPHRRRPALLPREPRRAARRWPSG